MKNIALVAAFGLTSLCAFAPANAADGVYVGVSAGASLVGDVDASNGRSGAAEVKTTIESELGYGAFLRLGKKFDTVRGELELGYRDIDIDSLNTSSGPVTNSGGDAKAYSLMVNGYYDFDSNDGVTPYVMGGLGALKVDADVNYTDDNGRNQSASGNGTTVAGQLGFGASYMLSPEVDLIGGYSFLGAPTDDTGEDNFLMVHTVQLGINYKF